MKKLVLVCLFFLSACSNNSKDAGLAAPGLGQQSRPDPDVSCTNDGVDGSTYMNGIVGGQRLGGFNPISSRIVLVYNQVDASTGYLCTGSLLPGNVILTAGHCVSTADKMLIIFNSNIHCVENNPHSSQYFRKVTSFVKNPDYHDSVNNSEDDLAMIHFAGTLYPGFTTFDFPVSQDHVAATDTLIMAGFGITGFGFDDGGVLRITKAWGSQLTYAANQNMLLQQPTTGICQGDSGSGLIIYKNGQLQIIGVASTVAAPRGAPVSATCNGVAAFVDLAQHQSWLQSTYEQLRDR